MQRQLEQDAQTAEFALVDLRRRYSNSQSELASVQLELGETLEIARRKSERAAAFKYTRAQLWPLFRAARDLRRTESGTRSW